MVSSVGAGRRGCGSRCESRHKPRCRQTEPAPATSSATHSLQELTNLVGHASGEFVPKAAVSTRSDVCQSGQQQDYRCLGDWGCHYAVLARPLSSSRAMAHCCGTCAVEEAFRSHRAGSDPVERQHAHPAIERLLSRLPPSLFSSPVRPRPAASPPQHPARAAD